jgi:tetraacyldisaccharide 4'-kinase
VRENGSPAEFGDEPLLIARHLDCPVVVGESRYEAGLRAEIEFGSQVHLLDDGFQHRSLKRDLDIVLLTSADLQDTLLPTGRLREPLRALHRADVVAVTSGLDVTRLRLHQKIVWGLRRAIRLQGMTQKPVVFCGIARPQKFFRELRELGVEAVAHSIFPDHHAYTGDDVEHLLRLAQQNRAGGFITTEKDLVNLGERAEDLGDLTIAQITIQIEPADALDTVLEVVTNRELQREKIRGQ